MKKPLRFRLTELEKNKYYKMLKTQFAQNDKKISIDTAIGIAKEARTFKDKLLPSRFWIEKNLINNKDIS